MSGYYNIIKFIPIGLRPFRLKCASICYINYSRKLSKVFIPPTIGIRAHGDGVGQRWQLEHKWGVCTWNPFTNGAEQVLFAVGAGIVYCTKQAHKAHTNDLEKGLIKEYYCQ